MTREYIGARYVPKFYENELGTPDWRPNVVYEPLTIVTYANNSYTSKKAVPADAGSPDVTPEYWAATGYYNAQIGALQDEVDQLKLDRTLKANNKIVSLQDFGVTGVGDESTKVADALQYAKDNEIDYIISSTDVSFQDITTDFSFTFDMMGHVITPIKYDPDAYRMNRLFYSNEPDIFFCLKNAIIKGVAPVNPEAPQSGAQLPYDDYALVNIRKADTVIIDNCVVEDINAMYYSTRNDDQAFIFDIKDVRNTRITNNRFINLAGLEIIWIAPDTYLTRKDINAVIDGNKFTGLYSGSSIDFIGNICKLKNNVYNTTYAGSSVNCFGLNVSAEDETFLAAYGSAYDISEGDLYHGNNFYANNINFLNADSSIVFTGNAANIKLSNISGRFTRVASITQGYGGTYPFADTTPTQNMCVIFENINSDYDGVILLRTAPTAIAGEGIVIFRNCNIKNTHSSLTFANGHVIFDNCILRTVVDPGYSSIPVVFNITSTDHPISITIKNCIIHNIDTTAAERIIGGNGLTLLDYLIIKDNYADTSATDVAVAGTAPTNKTINDNFNIA